MQDDDSVGVASGYDATLLQAVPWGPNKVQISNMSILAAEQMYCRALQLRIFGRSLRVAYGPNGMRSANSRRPRLSIVMRLDRGVLSWDAHSILTSSICFRPLATLLYIH